MSSTPHPCQRRSQLWACLLLLALVPLRNLDAQDAAPSFEDLAADANAARDVEDVPRAIQLYTQALQLNPKWEEGWWSLGMLRYGSREFASASDAFSQLLTLNPQAGPAQALRGLCEFETGDYSHSLADIHKGLAAGAASDAHNEQILRYHEGMLFTRLGNFQDALKTYSAFAERKLASPELLIAIGLAGLRMPLLPKDVTADQQPLLSAVGDATFKFMAGDQQAAQESFTDVFLHFPAARNAHFDYGNLLMAFGADAAWPQFKKELEVAPDNTNAMIMLAWSLLLDNRAAEALPYAKRIAEQDPERAASQLILGRALLDTGDAAGGIQHLERGQKLEPSNLEIHIALAKAYAKSGRNDDSRRERELCLQMTLNGAATIVHP